VGWQHQLLLLLLIEVAGCCWRHCCHCWVWLLLGGVVP
jgi:hypothetical protein